MRKFIFLLFLVAFFVVACNNDGKYAEQRQMVAATLAEGRQLPELYVGELYGGVLFMKHPYGWFVRDGKVYVLSEESGKLSPETEYASKSIISAAYEASFTADDLSSLKKNPPVLPPHLPVLYDGFYADFIARMSGDFVYLSDYGAPYTVRFGHWSKSTLAASYYEKGQYELQETGGWVTEVSLLLFYSANPKDQDGEYNIVPDMVLDSVFAILAPGSGAELHEKLIQPVRAQELDTVEYIHEGTMYSCRYGAVEEHPDYPGRYTIHVTIRPAR